MGSDDEIVFVRRASGLVREIGAFSVMAIAANYVIADGFYLATTGLIYEAPGIHIPLTLLLGGIVMSLAAFAIIFLTMAAPRTASDYITISRVLHPFLGYLESILVFVVHIWIIGALPFFLGWFWGSALIQVGLALGDPGIVAVGEWMGSDINFMAAFGIAFVILFGVLSLLGVKVFKYMVNALFAIALAAGIITIAGGVYAASLGAEQIKALWDMTYGAGAYDEIMSVAEAAGWRDYVAASSGNPSAWGWPGPWSPSITISMIVIAAYAFWGLEYANYLAGEIDKPKRNFFLGTLGAIALVFVYYLVVSSSTLLGFREFFSAYSFVMNEAADQLAINPAQTPTWAVFIASIFGGWAPILAIIVTLAVPLWVMNGIPVYMMVPSRISFALAFDRFFPEKMAEVNARFRTPHWSILVTIIGGILSVLLSAYTDWVNVYFAAAVTGVGVRWFFSAIACTILPYRRKDLFEQGYTGRIGGVPVMSIVGGAAVIATLALLGLGVQQIAGDPIAATLFILTILAAIILYLYYKHVNTKRGIEVERIFKEIPPA